MIKSDDFKVLTTKEEEQVEDLCSYYAELRKYLAKAEYAHQNELALKIKEKLNVLIKKILNRILKYEIIIDGLENIPAGPVIYASSHQDFYDIINSIYANPEHCLTLNASNIRIEGKKDLQEVSRKVKFNLHKQLIDVQFKKKAPRVIKVIKKIRSKKYGNKRY